MFSFRIRVDRSPTTTINTTLNEIRLEPITSGTTLMLKAADPDGASLSDAHQWALVGAGYSSLEGAEADGVLVRDALQLAFAKCGVGVDLGDRSSASVITDAGLQYFQAMFGKKRILHDVRGLVVFETEPKPSFASLNMSGVVGRSAERVQQSLLSSISLAPALTPDERVALALFHASYFERTADTRFILLVMSVEATIKPEPKSEQARALVDQFIKDVNRTELPNDEGPSLRGSLEWLYNESISRAGQRLARQFLGSRQYMDVAAGVFFKRIYSARSRLVHGNMPFPSLEEISAFVGPAEQFCADLLSEVIEHRARSRLASTDG